ncbi:MAG: hypothetical protein HKN23_19190 [Verrucomicrobiales bacterium]|nr:hypothetical protein [Verrucomicrobiales bacterium]
MDIVKYMAVGTNNDPTRSTFPIPAAKLQARKWKTALGSPITWAPYLPAVGAFAFLDATPAVFAMLVAAVTAGVAFYWKTHTATLEGKLLEELISESNREQDRELVEHARGLLGRGYPDYASTLGSFLERKQQIEQAIHTDGELTLEKQEVESLVDAVVFGVSDQLHRLADFDDRLGKPGMIPVTPDQKTKMQAAREEISTRVHDAYDILQETWHNLGEIINPAAHLDDHDTGHHSLEHAIDRLRQERDIAKRVRDRMTDDFGERFAPEDSNKNQTTEAGAEKE